MNSRLISIGLMTAFLLVMVPIASVEASTSKPTFVATLSGSEEVPSVDSDARGVATFRLNSDGTALSYRLIVANIDDVTASHIHLAPPGVNGQVVAFLFPGPTIEGPNGVIAEGTITDADLIGSLAGQTIADLLAEIKQGNAYVNVHSTDNPGGEIRGQIR